jgi:periplasmic protein TonB
VRLNPSRAGTLATAALHAAALAGLLSYEPARSAILAAAPIMVDWIAAPKVEPAVEPTPPPKPKPVHRKPQPVEKPKIVAAPVETPSPIVAPAPPPPPPEPVALAPAPAPAPVEVAPPVFNAAYLQNPKPPYSTLSKKMGEQGRVVLRVHVNPNGSADEVHLQTSSGYARLDESARTTVGSWKFVPAKRGNEPVSAWVVIPISFKLDS